MSSLLNFAQIVQGLGIAMNSLSAILTLKPLQTTVSA